MPTALSPTTAPSPDARASIAESRSPGALRSETSLVLQTHHSQRLVHGRGGEDGKQQIVGLVQYAALSRSVWNGALADDPYAHWWLVRMHEAIEESDAELQALHGHVSSLLQAIPGLSVAVAQSVEPVRLPLTFTNPFGFRGAYLLARFDELVRLILTARHVALADRDTSARLLADGGRHIRRAYNSVLRYRFLGINGDDIRLMTARGKEAEALMGSLPVPVLDGSLRAPHAPDPRKRSFAIPLTARRRAPVEAAGAAEVTEGMPAPTDGADRGPAP
jgi:integrating conjugative element protein (TIGR03761 family)